MTKEECYYLGRITKPFGLKGQVVVFMDVDDINEYSELDAVFVEEKAGLVPRFIEQITISGENKAVVTFEDLTVEQAHALVGHDLYLPLSMLPELTGNQFYFHEVVGFKVMDLERGDIGTLASILEYPAQPLFQIMMGETEILIPIIDEVIVEVDRANRILKINAPKGLIDMYLES